ncbi:MAG: hypothetical protein P8P99_13085, partial [Maricaulis sp.]|nr:hypothetical protein [Maricaulis sp.]
EDHKRRGLCLAPFLCRYTEMTSTDYIVGYGSLLNRYSRETYSALTDPVIPVIAHGWRRGWTVRYGDEGATYCGVRAVAGARLVAALVPAEVTPQLRHRERGYVFTEVTRSSLRAIDAHSGPLPEARFWIVVNRQQVLADARHPVPQSYIDTCLLGCLEIGGEAMALAFIRDTELWDGHWLNDRRHNPTLYPRHAPLVAGDAERLDALLHQTDALRHRVE